MKRVQGLVWLAISFLLSTNARAESLQTHLYEVQAPESPLEPWRVLAGNGRIYFLRAEQVRALEVARSAVATRQAVLLEIASDDEALLGVSLQTRSGIPLQDALVEAHESRGILADRSSKSLPPEFAEYPATRLATAAEADRLFYHHMRELKHRSQCFWRAEVWSHDFWTWQRYNSQGESLFSEWDSVARTARYSNSHCIASDPDSLFAIDQDCLPFRGMKVILFFSAQFQRQFHYKWWFHIAPFVYVRSSTGADQELVLDPEFMTGQNGAPRGPQSIDAWTNHFMRLGAREKWEDQAGRQVAREMAERTHFTCTELPNHQYFREHTHQSGSWVTGAGGQVEAGSWCFVRKFPQWYFDPYSVEQLDLGVTNSYRHTWVAQDLEIAYRGAPALSR